MLEDDLIVDLYWNRAENAIEETALKYGSYCRKISMNILNNAEDAEECVNDTYLKLWNAIPPQRPMRFSAFLGKITRNLSLNRYKEQRVQKRGGGQTVLLLHELKECISSESHVEAEYEFGELTKTINLFLYSAKREERIIFVRRYWYADSVKEIAKRFQISESNVKSMLFRMRKRLKVYLEKEDVNL